MTDGNGIRADLSGHDAPLICTHDAGKSGTHPVIPCPGALPAKVRTELPDLAHAPSDPVGEEPLQLVEDLSRFESLSGLPRPLLSQFLPELGI